MTIPHLQIVQFSIDRASGAVEERIPLNSVSSISSSFQRKESILVKANGFASRGIESESLNWVKHRSYDIEY